MSVTTEQIQSWEREAEVLRAAIDANHVAEAKSQLSKLKVRVLSCLVSPPSLQRLTGRALPHNRSR